MIIEPPENQYILEDEIATLTCKVQGVRFAYWTINRKNTTDQEKHLSYYRGLGVMGMMFDESNDSNNIINLTLIIPANLTSKVNNISCVAKDSGFNHAESETIQISVFKSFSKSTFYYTIKKLLQMFNTDAIS